MYNGFIKVCAASPKIRVADTAYNATECIKLSNEACELGAKLIVFPELTLTGATCGDLFYSEKLLEGALDALKNYMYSTSMLDVVSVIGLPFEVNDKLYNCAAVVTGGQLLGLVPAKNVSTYLDYARYFAPAPEMNLSVTFEGGIAMLGTKQFFVCRDLKNFRLGVELSSDLYANRSPSVDLAAAGSVIIVNPSAQNESTASTDIRESIVKVSSQKNRAAYIHINPSCGESTTDYVFSGHGAVYENGKLVARKAPFDYENELLITEVDVDMLAACRRSDPLFCKDTGKNEYCEIEFDIIPEETLLTRYIQKNPFIPENEKELYKACKTTLWVQAQGLAERINRSHAKSAVIGISGGLDSTLALIVAAKAMDILDRPRTDVVAVTMPCFGTTKRTKDNATIICEELGVTFREVDIFDAVSQHFDDIGHDPEIKNVVYENSQARERTQILMDIANQVNGLVVGTGDLSELALGWATYNGDHMSMYSVNATVPKTMVRKLVKYFADIEKYNANDQLADALFDILDTPVSPELLPADENDNIAQVTEDLVGPYEIHDFYIYYAVKYGFTPKKLFILAKHALGDIYDDETLLKWLEVFVRRFMSQQFKRSCMPDGPATCEISLSPRQGFKIPSDASSNLWMAEIQELCED